MENNLKREILLKQDTPMWHFQPNQSGCCLRATEVKPKLDKFLIKLVDFQDSYYLDKSKNNALDYKLWFEPIGCPKEIPIEKPLKDKFGNPKLNKKGEQVYSNLYPLFFANMGATDGNKKQLVYYPNGVTMHLFSFNTDLLNFIEEHLPAFFASHSFGTRQDKGFGFFSLKDKPLKPLDLSGAKYVFELPNKIGKNNFESLFQYINYFHKMIRSGIDEPHNKIKYKSFMQSYSEEENCTWDKSSIKNHLLGQKEVKITDREYLFRDVLGLATSQEWKKNKTNISISAKNVDRFKSPILYRPIFNKKENLWKIYIYLNDEELKKLKGVDFKIKSSANKENILFLKIYNENQIFNLNDYFDFIITAKYSFAKNPYNIDLNYIFKKLKKNENTTK